MSRAAIDRARGFLLRGGLGLLASTWRFREEIPEDCVAAAEGREPVVIAFWHGSMLPVWYRFRKVGASALRETLANTCVAAVTCQSTPSLGLVKS